MTTVLARYCLNRSWPATSIHQCIIPLSPSVLEEDRQGTIFAVHLAVGIFLPVPKALETRNLQWHCAVVNGMLVFVRRCRSASGSQIRRAVHMACSGAVGQALQPRTLFLQY